MNRRVFALLLTALLTVPTAYSLRADGPVYTIEDLGTIDGLVPTITGMNASGEASGYVDAPDGSQHAVRYLNGSGWAYVPGLTNSFYSAALAINASGDLTGYFMTEDFSYLKAFRFVNSTGVITPIDLLPGGTMAFGQAINASGEVVGYGDSTAGVQAWRAPMGLPPSVPATLAAKPSSNACGINDIGQIVGTFETAGGKQHAFRLETDGTLTDVGTFTGPTGSSAGCAVDAAGQVGGNSNVGTPAHAFLFTSGAPVDIDAWDAFFSNVNSTSNGVSVGDYLLTKFGTTRAFIHTAAEGTVDLNTKITDQGWVLTTAVAVNATGHIAGNGTFGGNRVAYRLTPPATTADTTPPSISSVTANPSSITPATKAMVNVTVSVVAADNSGETPACAVTAVDGHGAPAADSSFSGLTGSVRATGGTTYTLTVTCTDASNNAATAHTDVVVPPDTTKPVFTSLTASPNTIALPKGQFVTVTTTAVATDDSGETPACTLSGITAPGASSADYSVTGPNTGSVKAVGGRVYAFTETCTDGSGNAQAASVSVTVLADTMAPVIAGIVPSPATIAPPNNQLVPVTLAVTASDDVDDAPACALSSISASGGTAADYSITGAFSAQLRAVGGRIYRLNVTCTDAAGNSASGFTDVVVPADATAPVVTSLTPSPGSLWPPNGKMVQIVLSVQATDDVDTTPQCTLTSVTSNGGGAGDASVTGALTANVRAEKNGDGSVRLYTFHVTCVDDTGNSSTWTTGVVVSKDPALAAAAARFKLIRTALAHLDWHETLKRLVAELKARRQ